MPVLTVVIPVYNEIRTIDYNLRRIMDAALPDGYSKEIVIVVARPYRLFHNTPSRVNAIKTFYGEANDRRLCVQGGFSKKHPMRRRYRPENERTGERCSTKPACWKRP